jgi:hypothetical protein
MFGRSTVVHRHREFKAHMLDRFIDTDEGEVTEYLGCELVRDRKARTGQLIQAGYAERVLRVFNMWECNPVATPLDPNVRLSKLDCPDVVDPLVHRKYGSIVGCLSYLVNMTRPDLAFSFSQLSKFLQCPGDAHLVAAYRVLTYVKGTLNPRRIMILEWESAISCQVGLIAILPLI